MNYFKINLFSRGKLCFWSLDLIFPTLLQKLPSNRRFLPLLLWMLRCHHQNQRWTTNGSEGLKGVKTELIFFATGGRGGVFFSQKTTQNVLKFIWFFIKQWEIVFIFGKSYAIFAILCIFTLLLRLSRITRFLRDFFASKTAVAESLWQISCLCEYLFFFSS